MGAFIYFIVKGLTVQQMNKASVIVSFNRTIACSVRDAPQKESCCIPRNNSVKINLEIFKTIGNISESLSRFQNEHNLTEQLIWCAEIFLIQIDIYTLNTECTNTKIHICVCVRTIQTFSCGF